MGFFASSGILNQRGFFSAPVSAAPPPFSPTDISGLNLWLKADAGVVLSGNEVTEWQDQSGNNNNATPYTNNPIFNSSDKNTKPTISLTSIGGNERVFTLSSNPLGANASSAFAVLFGEDVCDVSDDGGAIFGNFGAPSFPVQTHYPYGPDCSVYDSFATTARKEAITPPITITNAWSIYYVHSENNNWESFANNQAMHSDNSNTYNNQVGGDDSVLYIGKQTGLGSFLFKGKVAELGIYSKILTTQERNSLHTYLNTKYAIY